MAVTGLEWRVAAAAPESGALDIHLTRKLSSPRLDQLLWVESSTTPGFLHRADRPDPADPYVLSFTPSYLAPQGRLYDQFNYGIKVNTLTGEVTVADQLPAGPRPRSFIILTNATSHRARWPFRCRSSPEGSGQ